MAPRYLTVNDLIEAREELYRVFARYQAPTKPSYSPYANITEADVQRLRSKPLRQLSGDDLSKFSMKALTTWGDATEFRHYLPRMLDLAAGRPDWTDIPTLFQKLLDANWRSWPEVEQQAVERYIAVLWSATRRGETEASVDDLALGGSTVGLEFPSA